MNQIQGESSTPITPVTGEGSQNRNSNPAICRNPSCGTVLPLDSVFCIRCSCSICGRFDENKDPSLWLVCEPDTPQDECCGLTCHIECAFKAGTLGVVTAGEFMSLDAKFWCTSCGKISEILGCWKKQLSIARDARSVDVIPYRISLSYRLLDGTSRFARFHEPVQRAMSMLQPELVPINHGSSMTGHGKISISVAHNVQKLCAEAIEMVDRWMSNPAPDSGDGQLGPACRFLFREISSSSVVIDLIDNCQPALMRGSINKYDIWCWRCGQEGRQEQPTSSFPATNKRIKISHLHPSTLYAFRIMSHTEEGAVGMSEAKCMMKSADSSPTPIVGSRIRRRRPERNSGRLRLRSAGTTREADGPQNLSVHPPSAHTEQACGQTSPNTRIDMVDLNAVPIPDLNDELDPLFEPLCEEDNIRTEPTGEGHHTNVDLNDDLNDDNIRTEPTVEGDHTNASRSTQKEAQENCSAEKSSDPKEPINESPTYFVEKIRMLEREGHISSDFRLNFITWFNFSSTERDRRAIFSYFQGYSDAPQDLGQQLVHSFYDRVMGRPNS